MRLSSHFHRIGRHLAFTLIGAVGASLSFSAQAAYGLTIVNRTPFIAEGTVSYAACRTNGFRVAPNSSFTYSGRGLCLIRGIHGGLISTVSGQTAPVLNGFSSNGSTEGQFVVAQAGGVHRVWAARDFASLPPQVPSGPAVPTVKWQAVAAGQVPPAAAFKGGLQRMGGTSSSEHELLPVCRGQVNGVYALGNAAPFYTHAGGWSWKELRCYVHINGNQELAAYEVLIVDPQVAIRNPGAVRWAPGQNGAMPAEAYDGKFSGQPIYACRSNSGDTEGWTRVGMMGENGCYMPYGSQNRYAANYEVLVVAGSAGQQAVRGPNEPRLAIEPDRPARVSGSGEDCTRIGYRCKARIDEMRAVGSYKINSVILPNFSGNTVMRFKKSQGSTWEMREDSGMSNGTTRTISRPYLEVERTDDHITLFSGPWDYGSNLGGKHGSNTVIFSLNNGMVNVGPAVQQTWEGTMASAGEPTNTANGWRVSASSQNIDRVMMAEPDNVLALTFKPVNTAQTSTFVRGNSQPVTLIRGADGQFGNYRVASTADGWLELYTVVSPQASGTGKWQVQFLKVDFFRNKVWELLGVMDQQPNTQDVTSLRTLARSAGPSKAWAEAYQLTDATVFSGTNIGAALGRIGGRQVAWTLREEAGGTVRWEELKNDGAQAQRSLSEGSPVGRLVTETGRTARSITFSGSEFGGSITLDWLSGAISSGSSRVGDFLTGATEYTGQRKKLPAPLPPGISPGFQFVNSTDWPVMVKIGQVGCLYHGVIPPHSSMTRHTGAVWFTVSAAWSTDGKDLTKEQIFTDCAAPVVFTTLGVIATAASGGSAVGVVALGASAAATAGAATTAVTFMNASGASQGSQDAVAAAIYVVGAAATGGVGAFQVVSKSVAAGTAAGAVRSSLASAVAVGAAREGLLVARDEAINYALYTSAASYHEPNDQQLDVLESWFSGEVSAAGQYAGYPWPWKMKDRVMPRYEITGGPRVDTLKDGSKLIRKGANLKMTRVQ